MRIFLEACAVTCLFAFLLSCSDSKPPSTDQAKTEPAKKAAPKPTDESYRFPKTNQVETAVIDKELLGKPFMPGGTLARYKKRAIQKGAVEYEMFAAKLPSADEAAFLLPNWQRTLTGAKLIPSFGGYFGADNGRPTFVFTKGAWIAGIAGLPEKEADAQARILAAQLN